MPNTAELDRWRVAWRQELGRQGCEGGKVGARGRRGAAREWAAARLRGPVPPPVRTPAAPLPHGRPHSAEQQCPKKRRDSTDPAAAQSAMVERTARVAAGRTVAGEL
ncbi:unnamed protein product, partial [Iphiclides podalirius]